MRWRSPVQNAANAKGLTGRHASRLWSAIAPGQRRPAPPLPDGLNSSDAWKVTHEGRFATWEEAASLARASSFPVSPEDRRASLRPSLDDWDGYLKPHEAGLLAAVMSAMASTHSAQKTVVDFGGGYGVHFLTFLKANLLPCRWDVVELKEVAEAGAQKWRHNSAIRFIERLDLATPRPDLLIASGVFQSLADPYAAMRQIEALEPSFLFIDRLPLTSEDRDLYTVQRIGPAFFGTERTAPYVLFSNRRLTAELTRAFDIVFRFPGFQDPPREDFHFEALFLRRRIRPEENA
ncbi:MAG TPA: methyltransferase, TIGR04325 family [Methylocella sp.]|nr:methyltransferase, TIGR04325 family [Methylocella sp.]